jgi:hypothetical protein
MGKRIRRALPIFLLTAAVPLIPVVALLTVPHPPSPACTRPRCHAFALGADSFRIPASRLELAGHSALLRPASVQPQLRPVPSPGIRNPSGTRQDAKGAR